MTGTRRRAVTLAQLLIVLLVLAHDGIVTRAQR